MKRLVFEPSNSEIVAVIYYNQKTLVSCDTSALSEAIRDYTNGELNSFGISQNFRVTDHPGQCSNHNYDSEIIIEKHGYNAIIREL